MSSAGSGCAGVSVPVAGALVAILGLVLVLVLDLLGSVDLSFVGVLWGPGAAVGLAVSFVVSATTDDGLPAGATKAQVG